MLHSDPGLPVASQQSYDAALAAGCAASAESLMPAELRNLHVGVVTGLCGDPGQSLRVLAELRRCSDSRTSAARAKTPMPEEPCHVHVGIVRAAQRPLMVMMRAGRATTLLWQQAVLQARSL